MAYKIKWENKGIYIFFNGKVDFKEFIRANNDLYGRSDFDKAKYQLWDFSEITYANFDMKDVKLISAMDKSAMHWNDNMKVAVLTNNQSIIDFANQYKLDLINTKWVCELFEDINIARKWISE